jgi:hypothetical protein
MKIKGLEGAGMSYLGLDFARRLQLFYDIPDSNVCFSPEELFKKLEEAKKKDMFILLG